MSVKFGKLPPLRYDPKAKAINARVLVKYMLARTQAMFHYEGLPDTIPQREYELMLQTGGHVLFVPSVEGKGPYVFQGGLGGEPNVYYFPTRYTVANPYLRFNKIFTIGEECELIRNDSMFIGILPILEKYAVLMAENELTMRISDINCRITSLLTAGNDRAKAAAEEYLRRIEAGDLGVIGDNSLMEAIKTQPYGSAQQTNSLTDLIEFEQYLKASMFNELGLNANFNMKREAIMSGEAELNQDSLEPFVDDMLRSRQECWNRINEKFGTNVTVTFASAWEKEDPVDDPEEETEEKGDVEYDLQAAENPN